MEITESELAAQYQRANSKWPFIRQTESAHGLRRMLLFAVGSRETNLTNEVGDFGHGHGVWQLDLSGSFACPVDCAWEGPRPDSADTTADQRERFLLRLTTAATIPHMLGEATLGELKQGLRGQLVRPGDDGYDEARAIETAGNRSDATASSVSMIIVGGSS